MHYKAIAHVLLLDADRNRKLPLRRLLEKLFTLHHHIRTITRIAWSRRLSPFLEGQFDVVSVPAARGDISIAFSQQDVLPVIFPLGEQKELPVCDELLKRLQEKAKNEGIDLKNGTKLSIKPAVHAESTLLAYHLQHPNINPHHYFGGSKLSCHGCTTFFGSFNLLQNLIIFLNSSPGVATTRSISGGLALPCCHWSNQTDYNPAPRLSIPRSERKWLRP